MTTLGFWLVSVLSLSLQAALVSATCSDDLLETFGGNNIVLEMTIPENTPAETLLLNVTSSDGLDLEFDGTDLEFIKVVDGAIYTALDIIVDGPENQEECNNLGDDQTVTVTCPQDGSASPTQFLIVQFNYTDDYPTILNLTSVSVKEQVSGIVVVDLENPMVASDLDCDTSLTIQVVQDPDMEQFFQISGAVISVIKPLDYETRHQYTMSVSVLSQLGPSGEQLRVDGVLEIIVEDVDDRDPVFSQQVYTLEIEENLEGEDLETWYDASPPIEAVDGDVGINAMLQYSILSSEPDLDVDISSTGQIQVREGLDREVADTYTIVVKAAQVDYPQSSATATLLLTVTDINDNRPEFSADQVTVVTLPEDVADGSRVVWLQASDLDDGENAEFDYILKSGSDVFEVGYDSFVGASELVVKNSSLLVAGETIVIEIDLEEPAPVNGGEQCDVTNRCVLYISVTVTDVNDHSPVFDQSQYDLTVLNITNPGDQIGQVGATDEDLGENAELTYTLEIVSDEVADCNKISVDTETGRVTLDSTMFSGVTCTYLVSACDNPNNVDNSLCGVATLVVTVVDAIPYDGLLEYETHIQEELPVGSLVLELPISGLSTDHDKFTIDESFLKTAAILDREEQDTYQVSCYQGVGADAQAVVEVTVYLDDVNDNAPVFESQDYEITVRDENQAGDILLQVHANDADSESTISYALLNMRDVFNINGRTGEITLAMDPSVAVTSIPNNGATLLVEAQDHIEPELMVTTEVKVTFIAVNESASVIVPAQKDIILAEQADVESLLSEIMEVNVDILGVESLESAEEILSTIYVSATSNDGTELGYTELDRLLDEHAEEIYKAVADAYGQLLDEEDDEDIFTPSFTAVFCVLILLILIAVIIFIILVRSKRQTKRELRLMKNLTSDTSIYDRAPVYDNPTYGDGKGAVVNNNNSNHGNTAPAPGGGRRSSIELSAYNNIAFVPDEEDSDDPMYTRVNKPLSRGPSYINGEVVHRERDGLSNAARPLSNGSAGENSEHPPRGSPGSDWRNSSGSLMRLPRLHVDSSNKPIHLTTIDVVYPPPADPAPGGDDVIATDEVPVSTNQPDSNWQLRKTPEPSPRLARTYVVNMDNDGVDSSGDKTRKDGKRESSSDSPEFSSRQRRGSIKALSESDSGLPSERDIPMDDGDVDESPSTRPTGNGVFPVSQEPEPDYLKKVRFNERQRQSGAADVQTLPPPMTEVEDSTEVTLPSKSEITAL